MFPPPCLPMSSLPHNMCHNADRTNQPVSLILFMSRDSINLSRVRSVGDLYGALLIQRHAVCFHASPSQCNRNWPGNEVNSHSYPGISISSVLCVVYISYTLHLSHSLNIYLAIGLVVTETYVSLWWFHIASSLFLLLHLLL